MEKKDSFRDVDGARIESLFGEKGQLEREKLVTKCRFGPLSGDLYPYLQTWERRSTHKRAKTVNL